MSRDGVRTLLARDQTVQSRSVGLRRKQLRVPVISKILRGEYGKNDSYTMNWRVMHTFLTLPNA